MRIVRVESFRESVPLSRPYSIAKSTTSGVELFFVRIVTDGETTGIGSGSPAERITGESPEACAAALSEARLAALVGRDGRLVRALTRAFDDAPPAAHAAVDTALWDLFARSLDLSLVDVLGRCHDALPTSITIGIQDADGALAEADEYVGRGFRHLKVKLGLSIDADLERVRRIRERVGPGVRIRVDANEGYALADALRLLDAAARLDLELVEQPASVAALAELRELPAATRAIIALDENLHTEQHALELAREPMPAATWVVKLMKCGGISAALRQADIAAASGRHLMWGCMDESRVSIAAALHAAYACPATRYLDLDGSFDLARDPAAGGFSVVDGTLVLSGAPGLGVRVDN